MYLVSITSCLHMSAFSISCWTLSTKNHGSSTMMYQPMPQALPYVILLCKRQTPSTLWLPICDGSDMLCKCFEEAVCHLLDPVKWHVHFMYLITVLLKFALKKCLSNIYNNTVYIGFIESNVSMSHTVMGLVTGVVIEPNSYWLQSTCPYPLLLSLP